MAKLKVPAPLFLATATATALLLLAGNWLFLLGMAALYLMVDVRLDQPSE